MIIGLPNQVKPPRYTLKTFCKYIPKLKEWACNPDNKLIFREFVDKCKAQFNYSYWLEDWGFAVSLGVAHYACITDPSLAQSVGADTVAGGVMTSRQVGGISYSYDTSLTMEHNPGYEFWYRTGYGTALVQLSRARGWFGMLIST